MEKPIISVKGIIKRSSLKSPNKELSFQEKKKKPERRESVNLPKSTKFNLEDSVEKKDEKISNIFKEKRRQSVKNEFTNVKLFLQNSGEDLDSSTNSDSITEMNTKQNSKITKFNNYDFNN